VTLKQRKLHTTTNRIDFEKGAFIFTVNS